MRPYKPFDTVTKELLEADPLAWLRLVGLPAEAVEIEDTNLTTLTADADRVLRVKHTNPYMANVEFQASHKEDGNRKLFRYAGLLHFKYVLPIESVVLLLRPQAAGPGFSGVLDYDAPGSSVRFRYHVARVWEMPVEALLTGALATLPLAPIAAVSTSELPDVIARMQSRLAEEPEVETLTEIWTSVALLMGLRYDKDEIYTLLKGVSGMEESVIYQDILEKGAAIGEVRGEARGEVRGEARGRIAEARAMLLRFGNKRLGAPDEELQAKLNAIASVEELENLADRLSDVESWQELLG